MTPTRSGRLYRTIVADPPWQIGALPNTRIPRGAVHDGRPDPIPYGMMSVEEIAALPVGEWAAKDAHLYLWTIASYLRDAFDVLDAWGFRYSTPLMWCKTPMGLAPGGTWASNVEFILFARRGTLASTARHDSRWFNWPRTTVHSKKPDAFLDMVEATSPGPYLEMFARRARFGWDYWGDQSLDNAGVAA